MKTREDVEEAIKNLESIWKDADTIPEYVRGQMTMLKWFLRENEQIRKDD